MNNEESKLMLACELKEQIITRCANEFTGEEVQPVCDKIREMLKQTYDGKIRTGVLVLALDMILIDAIASSLIILPIADSPTVASNISEMN